MLRRAVSLALLLAPAALYAQAAPSDADALAEQVRRLGANPQDLDALLTAGELSIRLEDMSAAGAFFARAEKVDPRSARVKAGEAAILVHSERPTEALRYFAQAEQLGLAPARFAAERGLAYDLLGDPGRAERDYRSALAGGEDAEARRRYALSLAIAGRQGQALSELEPLIRQNDRGAWRSRAFVLAMGGDTAGATRIAETMMPPGAATALQAFFTELPRLSAVDKAFAVHFGEVQATPQRLADARLPHEAPLPLAPVAVVQAAPAPAPVQEDRRSRRDRKRRGDVQVAVVVAPPPPPLPEVPRYQAPVYTPPAAATPVRDRPLSSGEMAALSAGGNRLTPSRPRGTVGAMPVIARSLTTDEARSLAAAAGSRDGTTSHRHEPARVPVVATARPAVTVVVVPPSSGSVVAVPLAGTSIAPVQTRPSTPAERASLAAAANPPPRPAPAPALVETPRPGFSTGVEVAAVGAARPPAATPAIAIPVTLRRAPHRTYAQADTVLSRIVAGLSVPASELAVPAPPTAADRRAAERRAAADRKAVADRKAAAEAKAQADREAAEERRAARAEPARIWVQVGGGANEAALGLSWRTIRAKAPQAFAGHQGWTTPLRATNRILAGPFRSDADARTFVNQLAAAGLQAFAFTSDAGQKVTRLATN